MYRLLTIDASKEFNLLSQLSDWHLKCFGIRMAFMGKRLLYLLAIFAGLNTTSTAQDGPTTVLELFTSQGCVSCVSSDAALKAHRSRSGILVLSWPVDYLDRFGWADTFAEPANTLHQKAYNKRLGMGGMVYTPELIVDGRLECKGNDKEKIRNKIEAARALEYTRVEPVISEQDGIYTVHLPETELSSTVSVRAVWYLSDSTIEVTGGENEGKWLHLTNVVRHSALIGEWDGAATDIVISSGEVELPMIDGVAILLHEGYGHGVIVGADSMSFSSD